MQSPPHAEHPPPPRQSLRRSAWLVHGRRRSAALWPPAISPVPSGNLRRAINQIMELIRKDLEVSTTVRICGRSDDQPTSRPMPSRTFSPRRCLRARRSHLAWKPTPPSPRQEEGGNGNCGVGQQHDLLFGHDSLTKQIMKRKKGGRDNEGPYHAAPRERDTCACLVRSPRLHGQSSPIRGCKSTRLTVTGSLSWPVSIRVANECFSGLTAKYYRRKRNGRPKIMPPADFAPDYDEKGVDPHVLRASQGVELAPQARQRPSGDHSGHCDGGGEPPQTGNKVLA
jgi:hypothetical protein